MHVNDGLRRWHPYSFAELCHKSAAPGPQLQKMQQCQKYFLRPRPTLAAGAAALLSRSICGAAN
jgi:hypothetical protein